MNTDQLVKIGFDPAIAAHVAEYVDRLNANDAAYTGVRHGGRYMHFSVDAGATSRNKYVRIVGDSSPGAAYGASVHAFVIKATGEVVKPAGWAGPAKSTGAATKGQFLSNFCLTDDDSRAKLWDVLTNNAAAFTGGYLYQ